MNVQFALEAGPEGYRIHYTNSGQSGIRSAEREPLGPDQLTKSRYMTGVTENEREMWFGAHGKLTPGVGDQWRMEQGNLVAELARREFPDGVFVGGPPTEDQLQSGHPLFEARFSADDMTVRADILRPSESGGWILTEIKSSTLGSSEKEVKQDVGFQMHVLEKVGLPVDRAEVMHLNPEYVHPGSGELFTRKDLTGEVGEQVQEAEEKAPKFAAVLERDEPPNLWPSRACNTCDCPEPCHDLPEHSVLTLPRLYYGHLEEVIDEGRWTLKELQGHPHLKPKHENYIQAARSGEPVIDRTAIRKALSEFEYPLYFLDFEAADYALPPFEDTSPWEKIPFQYSLHVVEEGQESLRKEKVTHREFLHVGDGDPRRPLAERLLEDIGPEGSIVVYNATFEKGILEDLQEAFPQRAGRFQNLINRLWDQGEIFQNGHYVHPSQKGSWSLKKVLPAFDPSLEYDDLDVQEGMEAVVEYSRMISPETSESEAEEIEEDLLAYCERDTWAMVAIHRELSRIAQSE